MKKVLILLLLAGGAEICEAQPSYQGEFQAYYQRVANFDYHSGSTEFDLQGVNLNGGGFGFIYNLTDRFGFWSQVGFCSGLRQGDVHLNLINESQGVRLSTKGAGPLLLYAKGGLGFTRYVFELPQFATVEYGQSFTYGAGAEVRVAGGMFLMLEATHLIMNLPNITGSPDRDKWDGSFLFTTGIAFRF